MKIILTLIEYFFKSACGKRPSGVPLIINGEDFDPGSYPWHVIYF